MDYDTKSLDLHHTHKGKFEIISKIPLETRDDLSLAYTPGVAASCRKIAENRDDVYTYTAKGNLVAVVTDGSAVLGLGNIGPYAAMPVMEGKCLLFKKFGGVDAVPICLATQDSEQIIQAVKNISPTFGGINLEDIAAPNCFIIEERLKKELDIPVFHDDQHGTAIVVLAGLINALKIVGKDFTQIKCVMSGIGAAGVAIAKILLRYGVSNIVMTDRDGALYRGRTSDMNPFKEALNRVTNPENLQGNLAEVIEGADVFIGVSAANILTQDMVKRMANDAVIFAMANPVPEIMPDIALSCGAKIVATGRSDFPNQINNILAFPGIFRGVLDVRASHITEEMKISAALALAKMVPHPTVQKIIPSPFEDGLAQRVAEAVKAAIH